VLRELGSRRKIKLVRNGHVADQPCVMRWSRAAIRPKRSGGSWVPTERRIRPAARLMSQFSAKA
jgi:hypothetical protein